MDCTGSFTLGEICVHTNIFFVCCMPGICFLNDDNIYLCHRMPRFRWDVIWLPLGPLSGAGICLYVDHLLTESSEEVKKLRSYMYAYKAN
ncbi:HISTONE-LYSINE N-METHYLTRANSFERASE [Salix purpurea]|uniref:HISTONE-LYSINE N-METHYLTRANSFERASE n=2 Tax=Salix TaxID=40685 RepID=A0A9Q0Q332_SALPP|nr:HISTONE-LYSINE N-METHYLTRANSFERASE [Salix purpurea]